MGEEEQLHAFLTSIPVGGEWSASRPGRFKSPRYQLDSMSGLQNRSGRGGVVPAGNQSPVVKRVDTPEKNFNRDSNAVSPQRGQRDNQWLDTRYEMRTS